jgi:hypothetical protein
MKKIFFLFFLLFNLISYSQNDRIINIQFGSNIFFNYPSFNQDVPIGMVYDDSKPVKIFFTLPPNTFLSSNGVGLTSGVSLVDFKKCNLQLQLIGNGPPVNYNFTFKSQDFYLRNFVMNRGDFSQIVDDSLIYVTFDNVKNLNPLGEELTWFDIKSGDLYANNVLQISNVTKNDFSKNDFSNPFTLILKKRCDILEKKYRVFISNLNCNTGFGDFGISNSNISNSDIPATIYHFDNRIKSYDTILIDAPFGTDLKNLTMYFSQDTTAIVKIGNVVQKSRITVNDFSNPVIYTFTSQAGTVITRVVIVKVKEKPSNEKNLTSYSILTPDYNETFNGSLNSNVYTVNLPYSTKLNSLVSTFKSSIASKVFVGSVLQKSGITANDFTSQVIYKVQAQDGSEQSYQVQIVKNAPLNEKTIYSYNISVNQSNYVGSINGDSISVTVPFGTSLTNLIANFQISKYSSVKIGNTLQVSGTTSNDFTNAITYTVTAEDGTTQNYVVTVSVGQAPKSSEKTITAFSFNGLNPQVTANISGTNITATVPYNTNLSNLVATFTASAKATVTIGQTVQISGTTANNFTNAVTYTVTAENGTIQDYIVQVIKVDTVKNQGFLNFEISGIKGMIINQDSVIKIVVPANTDITNLTTNFNVQSGATVKVGDSIQVSGITTNDFTNGVLFTISLPNGQTKIVKIVIEKEQLSGIVTLKNDIAIYPNPSNGVVYLQAEVGTLKVQIKDLQGRVVYHQELSNYQGEKIHLDLKEIATSMVFVHLWNNTNETIKKIEILK